MVAAGPDPNPTQGWAVAESPLTHREEVLAIHPGALGDVLQAVPALAALREDIPARLAFAGQPRLGGLLRDTGMVDEALSFEGLGLSHLFAADGVPPSVRGRLARFDRAVSWFGTRDALYPSALRSIIRRVIVAPPVPDADSVHRVWEHLRSTVREWTGATPRATVPLRVPRAWKENATVTLSTLGGDPEKPLLLLHPGAGGRWKRWRPDKLARAAMSASRSGSWQVLVHEGPADTEAATELLTELAQIAADLRPLHLVQPDLGRLAGMLALARAYIGADSGVSHLAAALGARAIVVYPPRTLTRWAPWSPTATAVEMTDDDRDLEQVAAALMGAS